MKIIYTDKKTEKLCTNVTFAKKKLNKDIAMKLHRSIEMINQSENLHEIIMYPPFHFHNLDGKFKGKCALDIAGRKSGYRLIVEPLDTKGRRYEKFNVDQISKSTEIMLIVEVSDHYE